MPIAPVAAPAGVEADARRRPDLLERAVAAVVEQEVLHRVVGDDDVERAVVVDVDEHDAERLAHRRACRRVDHVQPGLGRDVA